ncbi:MAG: pyruvate kinase [Actinobacteria bacterium]|nr:MAG: pyruvate kinase [Actinomycetota bacterium]
MRATKIICTIGPKSSDSQVLKKLVLGGMDAARFNLSFASLEDHFKTLNTIKKISKKSVASLFDLRGPKIRVSKIEGEIVLESGQEFVLTTKPVLGSTNEVYVNYPKLAKEVKAGQRILINEGQVVLKVFSKDGLRLYCKVITGGTLLSGKGVNLPGASLKAPALTAEDKKDIEEIVKNNIDWVGMSFVRSAKDVLSLKRLINKLGGKTLVMAKIEKREALENLDAIIDAADGVMVARGDLGIELPIEEVPIIQKTIVKKCQRLGKPVVIATQMLESMVSSARPTRAEASDVANAIFDETDAVLLSDETAIGAYPVESLKTMEKIIKKTEANIAYDKKLKSKVRWLYDNNVTDAISLSSAELAVDIGARAIVTSTQSGNTARAISRFRPPVRIIAVTPQQSTLGQLQLSWGVTPIKVEASKDINDMFSIATKATLSSKCARKGDKLIITAGAMVNVAGTTNLIKVQQV